MGPRRILTRTYIEVNAGIRWVRAQSRFAAVVVAALLLPTTVAAQMYTLRTVVPSVAVLGRPEDPRVPLVREAVDFWNRSLAEIGSPLRLGEVTLIAGAIPPEALQVLSNAVLSGARVLDIPPEVAAAPGDIVVALSDADFVSFAFRWPERQKALVAIKSERTYPLRLPNVARNVIAHEIGHVLGLSHNSDPAMLMCGCPAPCRPDAFISSEAHFFPLTADERARLLSLYPPAR